MTKTKNAILPPLPTRTPNLFVSTHFMTNAERALYYRSVENYQYPMTLLLDAKDNRPILPSVTFHHIALLEPYALTYIIDILRLAVAPETGWKITRTEALRVEHEIWNHSVAPTSDPQPAIDLLDEIALANGYQFSQNPKTGFVVFRAF